MNPTPIDPSEIKVGDRVRLVINEKTTIEGNAQGSGEKIAVGDSWWYTESVPLSGEKFDWLLLHRPTPEPEQQPDDPQSLLSVVRVGERRFVRINTNAGEWAEISDRFVSWRSWGSICALGQVTVEPTGDEKWAATQAAMQTAINEANVRAEKAEAELAQATETFNQVDSAVRRRAVKAERKLAKAKRKLKAATEPVWLTKDDPEPAVGSVVRSAKAFWERGQDGRWYPTHAYWKSFVHGGNDWTHLLGEVARLGTVRLIFDAAAEGEA